MEQAELDRIRQQFAEAVRRRLPGAPIERIEVLQHGDDPEVEPGQLLARVVVDAQAPDEGRRSASECSTSFTPRTTRPSTSCGRS